MSLIRSLDRLNPDFRQLVEVFLKRLEEEEIDCFVYESLRLPETQSAYYAQGRMPLKMVNELRRDAKLWDINEAENKKIITWTMQSKHLLGLAVDIVPVKNGKLWWNAPDEIWKRIAEISVACGLDAGYYWRHKDAPHHQWKVV